jgi:hypothetical protein
MKLSTLVLFSCISISTPVRVELHFESLCKQCQIHVAGFNDDVITGGLEEDFSVAEAGILSELELSIDYYGIVPPGGTCEEAAAGTEHGPDMCTTDRLHLCAQSMLGGSEAGAASRWWPFVHCMFMMVDGLKCGNNGHCDGNSTGFATALSTVLPTCALLGGGLDVEALTACANGPDGIALQRASYQATDQTLADGFAPAYVQSSLVEGADSFWRDSPDQLLYGKTLLQNICSVISPDHTLPSSCSNLTLH